MVVSNEGSYLFYRVYATRYARNPTPVPPKPTPPSILPYYDANARTHARMRTCTPTHAPIFTHEIQYKHHIWSCADKTRQADGKFFKVSPVGCEVGLVFELFRN